MTENPFLENETEDVRRPPIPGPHESALPPVENALPLPSEERVIDTGVAKTDGLDKCPKCGSAEVSFNPGTGMLTCMFCRNTWREAAASEVYDIDTPINELKGTVRGSALSDLQAEAEAVVTLKCQGCGAEVVVNTDAALQARCHWCRQTLSLNEQIPNGAVPDMVLPFRLSKEEAVALIKDFAGKRQFFAHSKFKDEFKPENIMGVYLPYVVIDGNLSASVQGVGEIKTRQYTKGTGDNKTTYYDADEYRVERAFDLVVDDLTTEASQERSDHSGAVNTNNVINAVLPFPVKEATTYNANYLRGFTSEKRDLDIGQMTGRAEDQFLSIVRAKAKETVGQYDRGVRWEQEHLDVHGTRWLSVYLPVWLYSYYEDNGGGEPFIHYIAVNAVTGETMGSVPVAKFKLLAVSSMLGVIISIICAILVISGAFTDTDDTDYGTGTDYSNSDRYDSTDRFGDTP